MLMRSWLFVPGNHERRLEKSKQTAADVVIVDLEDAVPVREKERAREMARAHLASRGPAPVFVRVNALTTRWCHDDVRELAAAGPAGIMLPKADGKDAVAELDGWLSAREAELGLVPGSIRIVPLIETALGLHRAYEIAAASPRVLCLAFGSLDFCNDVGIRPGEGEPELLYARSQLAVASRAAGVGAPVDTVYANVRDADGLARQARLARNCGFGGKLCIHPDQAPVVNSVFSPTPAEIEEAERIVAAYEAALAAGEGAIQLDGKMIDVPVAERARKIVAMSRLMEQRAKDGRSGE